MTDHVRAAVADAFTDEWGKVVATLIGMTGDWDLAEECAQDAFTQALRAWPRDGIPRRPGAWLTTVARNRALDRLRRSASEPAKLQQAVLLSPPQDQPGADMDTEDIPDERLRLIFTCCHPALPLEARVALTLRTLAGLTTAEIARAFLTAEPTMAKRLVRAKQKIRNAGIPYRVPPAHLLPERTSGVLGVLYLLFNEGYTATAGTQLVRHDLCAEAIRLTRALAGLMPDEPEADALLALMLFHHSRRASRVNESGELVTLEEQDRSLWDQAEIGEGVRILEAAARREQHGPYLVQAAIAQCHATARTAPETNWALIADLYGVLAELIPSDVVRLNRAVAVGMAQGPAAGLEQVDALVSAGALDGSYLLPATRADLLRRSDRYAEAAESYRRALELASNEAERRYLADRLAEMSGAAGSTMRAAAPRVPTDDRMRKSLDEA
ncbi:MAG: RNA polymerase sigma factor [Nocardiopsaceae bacterium]|nr:RNA polymerase sigma factor [Nocardiopsaceae bacterium]